MSQDLVQGAGEFAGPLIGHPHTEARIWAARITECWRQSVESIIRAGRLLIEAKAVLPHGEFGVMCARDLPFSDSTAQRLMAIARDHRLSNPAHVQLLPASWGTLYELTKLTDEEFTSAVAQHVIRPDMLRGSAELIRPLTRPAVVIENLPRDDAGKLTPEARKALGPIIKEVRAEKQIEKKELRTDKVRDLADKQRALPDRKFGVILADPEWPFDVWSEDTGQDRAAANHYPTSTIEVIKSRPIASIAADECVLGLWATVPKLPAALDVMREWGFTYVSQIVWVKDRIGTGYWFRNNHEILLIGKKGAPPKPADGTQWRSAIEAPRSAHSEKPDFQYEFFETFFPGWPAIELNARRSREGWDSWGLEAPEKDDAA